ncbi:hypothetical protein [Natrialba sp. INN-245]|uniref:hypothetical protein n=1 Tax=Natrialba sp. INN-245 TaxID=2690967 RepID=UPI001312A76D|nr:hypothetical protein [Natrialba sp. INN-245]MWV40543.1 hypothetical protein [Natrialba sp. INN-245]
MVPSPPTGQSRRLRTALERRFGIDPRALVAFRVALGGVLLFDVFHRARHLTAFYTDDGVLPRDVSLEAYGLDGVYSIHALSGEPWFQALLFAATALLAVALIVGYRPRLATTLAVVLVVSVHVRNLYVLNGGDRLFRELLFLAIFLPLGSRWATGARSTDESESDETTRSAATNQSSDTHGAGSTDRRIATPATAAVLLYIVALLANNAVHKLEGETWLGGDALAYALAQDHMTIVLGNSLATRPILLEAGTYVWLGLLVGSPLLFVFAGRFRIGYVAVFLMTVVGMTVSVAVGLFPPLLAAAILLFLSPRGWDVLESAAGATSTRLSARGRRLERHAKRGVTGARRRKTAFRAARPFPGTLAGDGTLERLHGPTERGRETFGRIRTRVGPAVHACVLVGIVVSTLGTFGYAPVFEPVETVDPAEHQWEMFAPDPTPSYGWYVVTADLEDGAEVDVIGASEYRTEPPPDAAETVPDFRWRRYLVTLDRSDVRDERFAASVCERVDARHDAAVESVTVTYTHQPIELEGENPESDTHAIVEKRTCS